MDEHNGEPDRPGQDEPFDAFGVRKGLGRGGAGDRGALVPYQQQPPAPRETRFDTGGFGEGADPTAYEGLRPAESSYADFPDFPEAPGPAGADGPTELLPKAVRAAREPLELMAATRTPSGGSARVRRVTTADYLLTVNPIDGTEVVRCPPGERRAPVLRTREERAAHLTAARPAPPPGPPAPELPLLERDDERERVIRLLSRGRSVRVTGPSGAGRTALLEAVAKACADLAPEGVLWLSGYHRTVGDVLQSLYDTVYTGGDHRPDRAELPGLLREFGAVVVVDDMEFGGTALAELLAAAPECAFLLSASPEGPAPAAESGVEEVYLAGLSRTACVDLLALAAGRALDEDEAAWAADLWFESEGLPLRFVQAGALLRQRDALRFPAEPDWDDSVWENGTPAAPGSALPDLSGFDAALGIPPATPPARIPAADVPLPSLAESAAPAGLLASRLSEAAREALAFAVALDGEIPHASHLPALVGDTHGDAALGEMTSVGLAVPVASHYRLAAGVTRQLAAVFTAEGELSEIQAHTAALHYAWWSGHPSVTPASAAAEAEAILASMAACRHNGNPGAAVLLARTVAPAFAAALHWSAWERALRLGQEAARLTGELAEEAYFHHELGVLALCNGEYDRARAELEASVGMRGVLADRQGSVVGRRTLALVEDVSPTPPPLELPAAPHPFEDQPPTAAETTPLAVIKPASSPGPKRLAVVGTRRNLVAAGTGVLLAAVLGTVVTLGATSGTDGSDQTPQVKPLETSQDSGDPETTEPTALPASPSTSPATPSTSPTPTPPSPSTSASASATPKHSSTSAPPSTTSAPPHHTTSGGSSSGGSSAGGSSSSGGSSSGGGTSSGGAGTTGGTGSNGGTGSDGGTGTPTGGDTGTPTATPTTTPPTGASSLTASDSESATESAEG
ncbi:tetratricopeptide repeat protein [Streptomyces sp. NRRL F-5123]|uniref:tetratricopeptide repeat protein n=1 Tax=Streptomyces sp. NRRL F-5123 TaxID=1463856 RepID=UPI000694D2DE|nr:ATP-binding protein [Streptomyces sp. NRRL F-5123]